MPRRKNWLGLLLGAWLWMVACSTFSVSLDQATLQIAVPTPVPTKLPLPSEAILFEVQANQGWQDTGLTVKAEQQFHIAYVAGRALDQDTVIEDGAGWNYVCGRASCCEPLPTARRGALIGRIDDEIFFVGNGGVFTAPADGHLWLRMNDCDEGLYDNSGALQIGVYP
jgi:hypothetical protein